MPSCNFILGGHKLGRINFVHVLIDAGGHRIRPAFNLCLHLVKSGAFAVAAPHPLLVYAFLQQFKGAQPYRGAES